MSIGKQLFLLLKKRLCQLESFEAVIVQAINEYLDDGKTQRQDKCAGVEHQQVRGRESGAIVLLPNVCNG